MKYLLGCLIASTGFYFANEHLGQKLIDYWDFVAFFVVIFGTFSVLLMSRPSTSMKILLKRFMEKFIFSSPSIKKAADKCWQVSTSQQRIKNPRHIEEQLLNDGLELMSLGFSKEKTIEILSQRYHLFEGQIMLISAWFRRCAKYPPAFGLAGTVLGLIHLMRGISAGIDAKETGLRMAVALVATFYGLVISNLVLNPLGEWLVEECKKDMQKSEMSIETIGLIIDGVNIVEIQEKLNSFLDPSDRINGLAGKGEV